MKVESIQKNSLGAPEHNYLNPFIWMSAGLSGPELPEEPEPLQRHCWQKF